MCVKHKLPDFIIAGAPRSGTTWLCSLLARHPQVGLAQPIAPEPKFFLIDELYARGLPYYSQRWFAQLDQHVIGEKSTNYLESATCAERIAEAIPHVKLVFVLRNPIDRAFSNYRWSRMNGHETLSFAEALRLDGERPLAPSLRYARPFDYLRRGLYAEHLRPYLDRFGRDQILLLRFDDICVGPEGVASRVHAFLDVSLVPEDGRVVPPVNQADAADLDADAEGFLADYYERPNESLQALTGFDVSTWSRQ